MTDILQQQRMDNVLNQRAHDLLLGHRFASQQIGFIHTLDFNDGKPIKKRTLLEVEAIAQQKRQQKSSSHQKLQIQTSKKLHTVIESVIVKRLEDIDAVIKDTIGIEDNVCAILDILATRAASVGRLEPLINDLSWLARDLVTLVNLPFYRNKRSKTTSVKVDTPALALRYVGLNNLQLVVPTFAMRHWMPYSTEPFPLLKRRLKDSTMSCAIAAQMLAQLNEVKPMHAFTLGMLLNVGQIALVRLFLKVFDQVWQREVLRAREQGDKNLHTVLLALKPDPLFFTTLLSEKSLVVSAKVIETMAFKYLPLNSAMQQLVNGVEKGDTLLPLAEVVRKARCYSQYLNLKEHQLIEDDELQSWFSYYKFTKKELDTLKTGNFTNFSLQID